MNFVKKNINDLKYANYNPRKKLKPEDKEYQKIKKSIEEFGYVDPIIINKDNTIIGGHQRLTVLKDLGYEEVDVIQIDIDKTKEKALNIALNKITGEWDYAMLGDLLLDLDEQNYDLEITGFDLDEIEEIMAPLGLEEEKEVIEDDFDCTPPEEPKAKYGDIYQLGDHRLMCGDSTKEEDVAKLMDGVKADMVFTDPPWNVNYGAMEEGNPQGYKPRTILNDFMGTEDFKNFMFKAFNCMNKASKEGCMTYVVMSAQEWGNMMLTLAENEYHWSSTIIWNKDHLVLLRKDYHTKYEPIWYGWKEGSARLCPLEDRKQSDVWDFDRPTKSEEHPTMKPIALVAQAINNSSKKGNIILDLFGGSGTTLVASEQTNRKCRMMELDPQYVDVIINRWETFTGKKAVKIEGEE